MKKTKEQKIAGRNNAKMLASFMHGCTLLFVISIVTYMAESLCSLIIPKIISFTVDDLLSGIPKKQSALFESLVETAGGREALRDNLGIIAAAILILAAVMGICSYLKTVFNSKASELLVENMRTKLYRHLGRLPFSWYMKNQTGDIIQRCTSDVETVNAFLAEQLTNIINTVLLIVMSLFFMYGISVPLATIALVSIPIIIGYSAVFHGKIGKRFLECDENEGKLSSITQENLTGVRVVRAFGREKYEVDKFHKQNVIYTDAWVKLCKLISLFWSCGDVICGFQVLAMLVLGTVLCVRGKLTAGDLIAILSYNTMLTWPVRSLGRVISEMSKTGVSVSRIGEIMSAEEEHDLPGATEADMSGDIVFDNVTFGYGEDTSSDGEVHEILRGISLTVKKGETVGILGMTGSGKSTLVSLLCRLYDIPDGNGSITVSGTDIRNLTAESLRRGIGIVLQEPFLFSRTLGENIGMTLDSSAPDYEARLKEAARAACLSETIDGFTKGYDTTVGERGVTLSGGQKQRTAIARLLASAPPVMIFDDSLSAVDSETDSKIRTALRETTADSTVIIISHRIQTLMSADKIIVMQDGRISESGTHDELLALDGIYKKINDIQTGTAE